MSKEYFIDDNTRSCPFHEKAMANPKNVVMAFSDQLHSDVRMLFSASCIIPQDKRKSMIKSSIEMLKGHIKSLEEILEVEHED